MRLFCCLALLALLVAAGPAGAEIYRWTDAEGRVHFTQDLSQVPLQQRRQAESRASKPGRRDAVQIYSSSDAASSAPASIRRGRQPGNETVYRIRVSRAGTGMIVSARLNRSVTARFLIDTGASDVLIPQSVADQLGIQIGPETRTKRYSTANGIIENPVVMLRSVDLGGAIVENVPASISPSMKVGLLGLSFFNHFTYNIDAAKGLVTLRPNSLVESGGIRGGRSEAQWRSEFRALRSRLSYVEREYAEKPPSRSRERKRLEGLRADFERQMALLDVEADQARVPMNWRD
jgi:clan AA aspartic protease (TIGR02281 family)